MPHKLSNEEYGDMIYVYGFCDGNGRAARREYERRFPQRRTPNHTTFGKVYDYVRQHGRFPTVALNERNERQYVNLENDILNLIDNNPKISTRRISHVLHVPQSTVWRRIKKNRLHPYHVQEVQRLEAGDEIPRINFSRWIIRNPRIVCRCLFTDEAQFTRDGVYNLRNSHIWAEQNPFATRQAHSQHKFSVNVWCGIFDNKLVGPHILPHRLTGEVYLDFLENILPVLLDDENIDTGGIYFQHDGAPPYYRLIVRNFLSDNFPNRWIGRGGPYGWPSRSCDFNPVDYYVWGFLKSKVYDEEINSREELLERIEEAFHQMKNNPDEIRKSVRHITRRATICLQQDGGHFEQLL